VRLALPALHGIGRSADGRKNISSALIAILRREQEAAGFLQIIATATPDVVGQPARVQHGAGLVARWRCRVLAGTRRADRGVAIQIVAQDAELAKEARDAFLLCGKSGHPAGLHLGDCASYAVAKARSLPLLFKGDDFPKTDLRTAN
jgi:ribonuclease VapC